jgi:uncharacterized LabA/DUF88 family protein
LQEYASGHKKADWDVGLAIDVVQMLDILDVVVIVSGDGDFYCLAQYLLGKDKLSALLVPNKFKFSALLKFKIFRPYLRFMNDLKKLLAYKKKRPYEDETS